MAVTAAMCKCKFLSILLISFAAVLLQTTTKKPKIPPAMRHLPPKIPTKTPVEDYATLRPDIDDDVPTTSGTGDSGYGGAEEWRQHIHHPPPGKLYQIRLQGYIC